jgi:hypothetical protein
MKTYRIDTRPSTVFVRDDIDLDVFDELATRIAAALRMQRGPLNVFPSGEADLYMVDAAKQVRGYWSEDGECYWHFSGIETEHALQDAEQVISHYSK